MQKFVIIIVLLLAALFVNAQESDTTYWKKEGKIAINFTQASFSNWAAGGQSSIAGVSKILYVANYKKENIAWDNSINLGYGLSKVQNISIQKNEDIIDLQSKLGIKANDKWFYSASAAFLSQFAAGYADALNTQLTSHLFAPAYLNIAVGMDYKPNDKFSLLLAPLTGKATLIGNEDIDETSFGLDLDATSRFELGASLYAKVNTAIAKNINLATELGLFSNYINNPENIDIDWKVAITMKVNKYISASIDTRLIYDADILDPIAGIDKIQFKELVGIGLAFSF